MLDETSVNYTIQGFCYSALCPQFLDDLRASVQVRMSVVKILAAPMHLKAPILLWPAQSRPRESKDVPAVRGAAPTGLSRWIQAEGQIGY